MERRQLNEIRYWAFVFTIASTVFVFTIMPAWRERAPLREAKEHLEYRLKEDPRFSEVEIWMPRSGGLYLSGQVASEADYEYLRKVIDSAYLQVQPMNHVGVKR